MRRQVGYQKKFGRLVLVLLAMLSFFLLPGGVVLAGELVSCRYQQAEGKNVSLTLEIGSPPPAMLILVQWIPKGISIIRATPPVKKYDPRTGEAKWLLKQFSPGPMLFSVDLDGEVSADRIHGEIRYKDPDNGKMQVMAIKP